MTDNIIDIKGRKMKINMDYPKDTSLMISLSEAKDALEKHIERYGGDVLVNEIKFLRRSKGGSVRIIEELKDFEIKLEDV